MQVKSSTHSIENSLISPIEKWFQLKYSEEVKQYNFIKEVVEVNLFTHHSDVMPAATCLTVLINNKLASEETICTLSNVTTVPQTTPVGATSMIHPPTHLTTGPTTLKLDKRN